MWNKKGIHEVHEFLVLRLFTFAVLVIPKTEQVYMLPILRIDHPPTARDHQSGLSTTKAHRQNLKKSAFQP